MMLTTTRGNKGYYARNCFLVSGCLCTHLSFDGFLLVRFTIDNSNCNVLGFEAVVLCTNNILCTNILNFTNN